MKDLKQIVKCILTNFMNMENVKSENIHEVCKDKQGNIYQVYYETLDDQEFIHLYVYKDDIEVASLYFHTNQIISIFNLE